MERATLESMLENAPGVERSAETYLVADGFRLSVYIGEPGQAMEIPEVSRLELRPTFCEVGTREQGLVYYLEYSSLHGISIHPPSGSGGRRAGFS